MNANTFVLVTSDSEVIRGKDVETYRLHLITEGSEDAPALRKLDDAVVRAEKRSHIETCDACFDAVEIQEL